MSIVIIWIYAKLFKLKGVINYKTSYENKNSIVTFDPSIVKINAIKEGIPVAIIGAPNAGKSTLLNALFNEEKEIILTHSNSITVLHFQT